MEPILRNLFLKYGPVLTLHIGSYPAVFIRDRVLVQNGDGEIVSNCSEFLTAGTDTTFTSLQWIMANLVRNPEIQEKLFLGMKSRPERFMSANGKSVEAFDMTGSREIRMMPFGAGRRMCPAYELAMMHLDYFVGNMAWRYEWSEATGEEVDLSEKQEFTMVMKHPLNACITERRRSS